MRDNRWWSLPADKFERVGLVGIATALSLRAVDASDRISSWSAFSVYLLLSLLLLLGFFAVIKMKRAWQLLGFPLFLLLWILLDRVALPALSG